jgi:hypothetical protein
MTATAHIVIESLVERVLGSFTVDKDTIHITSVNGTIDLVLPRVGKDENGKERPRDFAAEAKIMYPVGSPEFTDDFREWMGRVQRASDSGRVPTGAEIDAEWRKDHPKEQARFEAMVAMMSGGYVALARYLLAKFGRSVLSLFRLGRVPAVMRTQFHHYRVSYKIHYANGESILRTADLNAKNAEHAKEQIRAIERYGADGPNYRNIETSITISFKKPEILKD